MNLLWGPFAFRESEAQPFGVSALRTAIQTFVMWSIFLILLPAAIRAIELWIGIDSWRTSGTSAAGVALFALGGTLGLVSALVMVREGKGTPLPAACARALVVAGPYRWVRNPMAVGGIVQGFGVGLFLGSTLVLLYALAGAVLWNLVARPAEERYLAERFGNDYTAYRKAVRCWVPRLRPYRRGER